MMTDAGRATGAAREPPTATTTGEARRTSAAVTGAARETTRATPKAEDGAGSCADRDDQSCTASDAPRTWPREHQRGRECEHDHEHEQHEHIMDTKTPRSTKDQSKSDPKNHPATTRGWSTGRQGAWKRDGTTPHG